MRLRSPLGIDESSSKGQGHSWVGPGGRRDVRPGTVIPLRNLKVLVLEDLSHSTSGLKSEVGRVEVGRLHDWEGSVWPRPYIDVQISDVAEAQINTLRYLLEQDGMDSSFIESRFANLNSQQPKKEPRDEV